MIDETKLKIFGGCMHPKLIHNKHTDEDMFVSCGECVACVNQKANVQAMRVKSEILSHKYSVFFTLTYSNEFLPRFECISDKNGIPQFRPIGRCEYMFDSCPLNYEIKNSNGLLRFGDDVELPPIQGESGSLQYGVCCKKDVQNFLKRLRKLIYKEIISDEKSETTSIRYYVASEYGPKTFRPHYHGIIFFDNAALATKISDYIVSAWSYRKRVVGKRNSFETRPYADVRLTQEYVQMCDERTSFYVARYVAGNLDIPPILRERSSKPFHLGSKSPVIGSYKASRTEILEMVHRGTYRIGREVYNEQLAQFEHVDISLSSDVCRSIFRKCKGFSNLSFAQKYKLYSFYGLHIDEWRSELNKEFERMKYIYGYSTDIANFLQSNRSWRYHNWIKDNYNEEYTALELDLPQNWYSSRLAWRVVSTCHLERYSPWLDPYVTYVRLFDKYNLMKFSDTQLQFYQLFNDLLENGCMDFQTAMFAAYPFLLDNIPTYDPCYFRVSGCNVYSTLFIEDINFGNIFYRNGMLNVERLEESYLENSPYYHKYCLQQRMKLEQCNKSKKYNNSMVYGQRKIQ